MTRRSLFWRCIDELRSSDRMWECVFLSSLNGRQTQIDATVISHGVNGICYSWPCVSVCVFMWPRHKRMLEMKTFQPYFLVYSIYNDYFLADGPRCHSTILSVRVFHNYLPRGRPHQSHLIASREREKNRVPRATKQHKYLILLWENIMCKCSISFSGWMTER